MLPLLLHLLDVKLSSTPFQFATKQQRLNIITAVMEELRCPYDGADYFWDVIARMIEYISLESPPQRSDGHAVRPNSIKDGSAAPDKTAKIITINNWGDIFLRQPTLYLRLTLTIDYSLSWLRFPVDTDFPLALQSKPQTGYGFSRYCILMNDSSSDSTIVSISTSQSHEAGSNSNDANEDAFNPSINMGSTDDIIPTTVDSSYFESTGFELPVGFEASDFDISSKMGFGFNYSAWSAGDGRFPETM
jgi:hypothetical protein